ncbi:MAG: hypothetical protein KA392_17855, partial [Candidatus Obscuribacter sp.]|nr:hypothetical protein [Candidatus Obscuribacter sp.]
SDEAKAIGTVAAGENANLFRNAVNDPNGINPSGVSNADAFKNATGVSAQQVTEAAQGNPVAGREVANAMSNQTQDRSVVGGAENARSISGNVQADAGRTSVPDAAAPVSGQVTNNSGSPTPTAPSNDVFRSGTADVTTAAPTPQPGANTTTTSGQPVASSAVDVVGSSATPAPSAGINTEPVRSGGFDGGSNTLPSGNPVQPTHQPGSNDNMRVASADTSTAAPVNAGPNTAPQPVASDSVRTSSADMSNQSVQANGAPQVGPQPSGNDSFRANPVDNSATVHNPSAPVAPQPNGGDSIRANPVDNSATVHNPSAPVAPQPNSGDSIRANPVDNSANVHNPSAPVAPQPSGNDSYRANPVENSAAVHNPSAPVAPQPSGNDSYRANPVENSAAVHNPSAPVAPQPNSGDSYRGNPVENSGAPQAPHMQANAVEPTRSYGGDPANANVHAPAPSSQPTNQPSSAEPIRTASSDVGYTPAQPSAPGQPTVQTSGDTFRSGGIDNSGAATVHQNGPVPGGQPTVNSDSPRVNNYDASHNTAVNPVQSQPGVNNSEPSRPTTYDGTAGSTTNYQGTAPAPQPVA